MNRWFTKIVRAGFGKIQNPQTEGGMTTIKVIMLIVLLGCRPAAKPLEDNLDMDNAETLVAAVEMLEDPDTYRDVGVASIHSTVETLILSKPGVKLLESRPDKATTILLAHLKELSSTQSQSDFPRIGFFVTLGHLGQRQAMPILVDYLKELPDGDRHKIHRIDHPFRYVIHALELISGDSLGLGPGEDLEALFDRRHVIAESMN